MSLATFRFRLGGETLVADVTWADVMEYERTHDGAALVLGDGRITPIYEVSHFALVRQGAAVPSDLAEFKRTAELELGQDEPTGKDTSPPARRTGS